MNEFLVDDAALGRVRAGVMGRVRRRKRVRRAGVLIAVLGLFVGIFAVREPEVERLTLTMPAAPGAPEWVPVRPVVAAPVVMAKAAGRPAERITIFTDDPNVVIVLVGEGGQE